MLEVALQQPSERAAAGSGNTPAHRKRPAAAAIRQPIGSGSC
jgi:hypothetical protein